MAESMVERAARAAFFNDLDPFDQPKAAELWDMWHGPREQCLKHARAAIEAMRAETCVFRQNGEVVHELRGAPDDIWKTLLDAALTQDTEGSSSPS
jgi:hypothetical protein